MIKHIKLKNQLYIFVLATLCMFMVLQLLYYISFSTFTYRRAEVTAEQMMEQAAQNVENMMTSVESSARGLSADEFVQELLISQDVVRNYEIYNYVNQIVSAAKFSNSNIYAVFWLGDNNRRVSDPTRDDNGILKSITLEYDITSEDFREPFYTGIIQGANKYQYYSAYIFPVYSFPGTGIIKIGSGIIAMDIGRLESLIKINNITENSLFVILDQNDSVVVSNKGLAPGTLYEDIFWEDNGESFIKDTVEYQGMRSIAQCRKIAKNGWKIVSIIPREELTSELNDTVQYGILVGFVCAILMVFLGHILIKNIMEPINTIVAFLKKSQSYALKERIEEPLYNEIGIIGSSINMMLDRVEAMTRKIVENQTLLYESKLAEQDAELLALQSQINPHFLYNTLNCLSNIGLAYDVPEVQDISIAMSNIYRYSIKGDKMVELSEEIACIKEYMKIMDIRFSGKFEAEFRMEESLLKLYTLRMILQPVVENAVYHGMEQKKGKGKLLVEGIISDEKLILTVQDNGKGMTKEQLDMLRKAIVEYENIGLYIEEKRSIGLSNINKRIKLQFGKQYGLYVESEESVGTTVSLILPVIQERPLERHK